MSTLEEKLYELSSGAGNYPFHMPGHKRRMTGDFPDPYSIDITEISGFDNLHHPENILLKEQESAAEIYGSKKCFFLVNGSTCGILAAISAAAHRSGKIVVARNCHKSVYNAIFLRQLSPVYVYPAETKYGFPGQINPADIEKMLAENPDAEAVVITSPTYEGIVSDINKTAEIAHKNNIPLIVDEAHGAHFGLHPAFPENATRLGADAVIMSTHKTLPAFTQSAQLHLCSDRIDAAAVQDFLWIYESSSPSYILLCGLSRCMAILRDPATQTRIENYIKMLADFREKMRGLRHLYAPSVDDLGKIIISTKNTSVSGEILRHILSEKYHLELEMSAPAYALAMTSFMDEQCGFDRLAEALIEIDKNIAKEDFLRQKNSVVTNQEFPSTIEHDTIISQKITPTISCLYPPQEKCLEIHEALEMPHESVPLAEAEGRICADYICLYPPGIPILAPGERIDAQTIKNIFQCIEHGLNVQGVDKSKIACVVNN